MEKRVDKLSLRERIRNDVLDPSQSFLTIGALGILGIAASESYLPGYGTDLFGGAAETALASKVMKYGGVYRRSSIAAPVAIQLGKNFLYEFGQKVGIIEGTFDIKDFVAYVGGAIIWLGIYKASERFVRNRDTNSSKFRRRGRR